MNRPFNVPLRSMDQRPSPRKRGSKIAKSGPGATLILGLFDSKRFPELKNISACLRVCPVSRYPSEPQSMVSVSILAGGKSSRMGRNKARLRLGSRPMLLIIRDTARGLNLPCRIITRDRIPQCGPLSGIFTALATSSAKSELVLACDMPFISVELLQKVINYSSNGSEAVFCGTAQGVGFPCLLPTTCLPLVKKQIALGQLSLQELARACHARTLRFSAPRQSLNLNTPEDFAAAQKLLQKTSPPARMPKNPARPACKSPPSG